MPLTVSPLDEATSFVIRMTRDRRRLEKRLQMIGSDDLRRTAEELLRSQGIVVALSPISPTPPTAPAASQMVA